MNLVRVKNIEIGNDKKLVLIAGPCVIENKELCIKACKALKEICRRFQIPFIFKSSYDKAIRTSIKSFRGPGLKKGLKILSEIKERFKVPIISDVHSTNEIREAKKVLDIIQIPAFLSRQTDLITTSAKTGLVLNVKKGQFMAPEDMKHVIKKIESVNCYDLTI